MSGAPSTAATVWCTTVRACRGSMPPAARAQQQRGARVRDGQRGPAIGQPRLQRRRSGLAERHGALLVALAQHPQQPARGVDVVDVEAAQLADANSGGVQHLDDQPVAQRERITLLRTGIRGGHGVEGLVLAQTEGSVRWALGTCSRVAGSLGINPRRTPTR